jgi:hypothetical protein
VFAPAYHRIYLPAQEAVDVVYPTLEIPVMLDGSGRKVLVVEDDHATLVGICV